MLRERGLRLTPQRQLILSAIASLQGHISADSVHQQVVEPFPNVNISTVYRTLELLQDLGLEKGRKMNWNNKRKRGDKYKKFSESK